MHSAIENLLEKYDCSTTEGYKNALKEIIQEIALLGLFRAGFFDLAAFYGGTALRLFYHLERFSEDLDFSLLAVDPDFDLQPYCIAIQAELGAYGFEVDVSPKEKRHSAIASAFIKGETLRHLLKIRAIQPTVSGVSPHELLKVKVEVDTHPPPAAEYEIKYALTPIPYSVRVFTAPCLFAGKIHAVLCRAWKNRVKGRDLYDYLWYLSRGIPVHLAHLEQRLIQTQSYPRTEPLTLEMLRQMLQERFATIDYRQAQQDVRPFIKDPRSLELWSAELFTAVTRERLRGTVV